MKFINLRRASCVRHRQASPSNQTMKRSSQLVAFLISHCKTGELESCSFDDCCICWLSRNREKNPKAFHLDVIVCFHNSRWIFYKLSWNGKQILLFQLFHPRLPTHKTVRDNKSGGWGKEIFITEKKTFLCISRIFCYDLLCDEKRKTNIDVSPVVP